MAFQRIADIPALTYGTAFKFDGSAALTTSALRAGFRGIDTAGSATAYREALVGEGITTFLAESELTRENLYIQTKFSPYKEGKDPSGYPYDTEAAIEEQVEQSFASSLKNLNMDYVDCLVLHSLYPDPNDTIRAWKAMETLVPSRCSYLGLSNTDAQTLQKVYEVARVKPTVVQNRFTKATDSKSDETDIPGLPYPQVSYDRDVRSCCRDYGVRYNPWGILWGNSGLTEEVSKSDTLLQEIGITKETALLACIQASGLCAVNLLCGTTRSDRMEELINDMKRLRTFCASSENSKGRWEALVDTISKRINLD
ncbi:hypothetical protein MMC19_003327 [Ptychographa xylographoides]|nr:hypothetical protein [Ptychographa xylographoides]